MSPYANVQEPHSPPKCWIDTAITNMALVFPLKGEYLIGWQT